MAEYIECEALIQHMQECKDENAFTLMATGYAYSFIEAAPSADVLEVVHGEWVEEGCHILVCSKCNFEYDHSGMPDEGLNYCPNCGAKMDGDKE